MQAQDCFGNTGAEHLAIALVNDAIMIEIFKLGVACHGVWLRFIVLSLLNDTLENIAVDGAQGFVFLQNDVFFFFIRAVWPNILEARLPIIELQHLAAVGRKVEH